MLCKEQNLVFSTIWLTFISRWNKQFWYLSSQYHQKCSQTFDTHSILKISIYNGCIDVFINYANIHYIIIKISKKKIIKNYNGLVLNKDFNCLVILQFKRRGIIKMINIFFFNNYYKNS